MNLCNEETKKRMEKCAKEVESDPYALVQLILARFERWIEQKREENVNIHDAFFGPEGPICIHAKTAKKRGRKA